MTESTKNKHLTQDQRQEIQECLDKGMTFKDIARRIGKDQTTVSKEVKKHITIRQNTGSRHGTDGKAGTPKICAALVKAPFVCNPCKKRYGSCGFQKQYYNAKNAQSEYRSLLREAREGIPLNKEEFYEVDRIVTAGIKRGQHIYHIMQANNIPVSKSTIYRHLHRGYLSASKVEFPRVVKFKARRKRQPDYVPKAAKMGRTYEDFLAFIDNNGVKSWVEMDTVIGRVGGKVLLTFDFTFCNFMAAILLDNKTAAEVSNKIKNLKADLAKNGLRFGDIFPLLLTDNGGEFSNVSAFESDLNGLKETALYFCDPYKSCQKPKVEKNHTLFRDIVPKGESFDSFTQETVNLIFSHVNSVKRKIYNGKTPFELFTFTYGTEVAKILGIDIIASNNVIQSPLLLK